MFANCYVPTVVTHWGDWICGTWSAELLNSVAPHVEQVIDPIYYECPDRSKPSIITDWIELPWATKFEHRDVVSQSKRFDKVLATHHRHTHKRSMYAGIDASKLLFFDAHGISFRCVHEDWYPTLRPTARLEEEFKNLNLPSKYNVIHLNEPLNDVRKTMSVSDWLSKNVRGIHESTTGIPLVSTSSKISGVRDLSSLHGWLKILVLVRSNEFWGSHSGFTSIASMYRKRVRSNLINGYGVAMLNMGPPPFCYTDWNVIVPNNDLHNMYGMVEKYAMKDSRGSAYLDRCNNAWRDWRSFESLDAREIYDMSTTCNACNATKVAYDAACVTCGGTGRIEFQKHVLYEDVENCLVPMSTLFVLLPVADNEGNLWASRPWSFLNDAQELTKISRVVLDPEMFKKYHQ